jgi:hypothetical protein
MSVASSGGTQQRAVARELLAGGPCTNAGPARTSRALRRPLGTRWLQARGEINSDRSLSPASPSPRPATCTC